MLLFSSALQVCPWRADSVECYAAQSAHTFLATFSHLYLCARDASVRATNAWGHLRSDKRGQTQCYQTEKGSSILDACTESYLLKKKKIRRRSLSPLLVFSFFLLLSLLLTVFDCIRQVNEKQHWRSDWQPAPARVYVCVHIPASAYVWPPRVLRRASQPVNTMMRQ